MLNYSIINTKPTTKDINGEEMLDLLADNTKYKISDVEGELIIVNEYYVARPDLLSLAAYGTDEYGDVICKVNGISNPFEINEDMPLIIPSIGFVTRMASAQCNVSEITDDLDSIAKRISNYQKLKNEKRSPAEQTIGDSNYIIDKSIGIVLY